MGLQPIIHLQFCNANAFTLTHTHLDCCRPAQCPLLGTITNNSFNKLCNSYNWYWFISFQANLRFFGQFNDSINSVSASLPGSGRAINLRIICRFRSIFYARARVRTARVTINIFNSPYFIARQRVRRGKNTKWFSAETFSIFNNFFIRLH